MNPSFIHAPGTLLAGKYRVLGLLGAGGMGAVYEVENEPLRKRGALKVLHERPSPERLHRFQREMKADGVIGDPHIVETYDAGLLETGEPYVVMELLRGEVLSELILRKGRLDLEEICVLVGQACEGVEAAHKAGVIHRDLKPANLFVTTKDGAPFVKLLDFGVSRFDEAVFPDMTATREGVILGTPYVMSPEQIRGEPVDARSDVYALGVILYECATGRAPFRAETLQMLGVLICEGRYTPLGELRPDLPEVFRSCVARAMAVERHRRFSDARALGEALAAIGAGELVREGSAGGDLMRRTEMIEPMDLPRPRLDAGEVAEAGRSRGRGVGVMGLVLAAVLGAFGAGATVLSSRSQDKPIFARTFDVHVERPAMMETTPTHDAPPLVATTTATRSVVTSRLLEQSNVPRPRAPASASIPKGPPTADENESIKPSERLKP